MSSQLLSWRRSAILGLALACLLGTSPARADFYQGELLYSSGQIAAAVAEWRASGLHGDVLSQKRLGDLYASGDIGVRQDYVEAHLWYNLAAVNAQKEAIIQGGQATESEAQKKAGELATASRNRLQANMIADDIESARRKFVRVHEAGGPLAIHALGVFYSARKGGLDNPVEAYRYQVIAAAMGVKEAVRIRDFLEGNLTREQIAAAQKAAKEWTPPPSPFEDDTIYPSLDAANGPTKLDNKLIQYALRGVGLYRGGIDGILGRLGGDSQSRRGIREFQRLIHVDDTGWLTQAQAIRLVQMAAARGDRVSQNTLGALYAEGSIEGRRDYDAAKEWFQKAAEQRFPTAYFNLGLLYENGRVGYAPDLVLAREYYQVGADLGSPEARRALQRLRQRQASTN